MILLPGFAPVYFHIPDLDPVRHARAVHGNGQPLFSLRTFDLIAVPPAMLVILHVIIENEQVGAAYHVKIPAPWNIGRLQYDDDHSPASVVLLTMYGCLPDVLSNIRARYSPMIPRAKSWTPLKSVMAEARNEKPGIDPTVKKTVTT